MFVFALLRPRAGRIARASFRRTAPAFDRRDVDGTISTRDTRSFEMIDAGQKLVSKALPSVTAVEHGMWDRLFPDTVEAWDYYRACERSAPQGFTTSAIGVFAGNELVAAAPLFNISHRLDTSLEGPLQPIGDWIGRKTPRLLNWPVLGMGSPLTEECPIGMLPSLSLADRAAAMTVLLDGMAETARAQGVSVLAIKDVTDADAQWADAPLRQAGYMRAATLPVATLPVGFRTEAEYLASLSANMRKDLKRKMKSSANVQIEIRDSLDGIEEEVVALFEETKARRRTDYADFDEVPPAYFGEVVRGLRDKAIIVLCRVEGTLASFSLSLAEKDRIIAKYIGMRYPMAQEHNIYFVNWMAVVRLAIARGASWLQVGHTTYKQKVRLGCSLKRSWVYFRHRNPVLNAGLRLVSPYLAFDAKDPDLKELGATAPYLDATGRVIPA